ncbi:DUF3467 domain-containing protein [Candidatus Woesearchaeota archaeon]|nr:DUF3467 domain-containing protein [Candidatus Woesearchaeota archaeon]MBW3022064.1 DUF3467 domain-containing protein [Candidatus Woesearchaeota archaeon]
MEQKKINLSITDGDAFFAHELSINFNPMQFIFDFKNVTPRIDPRSRERNTLCMVHNVIMTDPYHAKQILELLKTVVERYEKEFGKIDKPKALKSLEKKVKKDVKNNEEKKTTRETPHYLG